MADSLLTRTVARARVLRTLPIARLIALAEIVLLARQHVTKLTPHERRRIRELVVRGRGRPSNLSAGDRTELAMLVAKAEPKLFARNALRKFSPIKF
jgi:hypothetical protein